MAKLNATLASIISASVLSTGLTGCALFVPPPTEEGPRSYSTAPVQQPTTKKSATAAPGGFSDYEKAALRVRNVGCGGVSSGSGFAISSHVFVTNRHVIGGAAVLQASTYDGHDIEVRTVGSVAVADLALVWTEDALPASLSLANNDPAMGSKVTAVGFPLGGPLTTTRGKVLGYGPDPVGWSPLPMLVNDAPIEHGSSGSPLIDDQGKLVGVAYAGDREQFAVPVSVLRQVLNDPSAFSNESVCHGVPR